MTGDPRYESQKLVLITLLDHIMKKISNTDPVTLENTEDLFLNCVDIYTIILTCLSPSVSTLIYQIRITLGTSHELPTLMLL